MAVVKNKKCREEWQPIYDKLPQNSKPHPYLVNKKIDSNYKARIYKGTLFIPAWNKNGFVGGQRIYSKGGNFEKRFTSGIEMLGCYCRFGNVEAAKTIYVGEGFATAASVWMAVKDFKGVAVVTAFNTANLFECGKTIREINPDCRLIYAADNDEKNNIGERKALEAAKKLGNATVKRVEFANKDAGDSDFNDLHCKLGIDEVRKQLDIKKFTQDDFKPKKETEMQKNQKGDTAERAFVASFLSEPKKVLLELAELGKAINYKAFADKRCQEVIKACEKIKEQGHEIDGGMIAIELEKRISELERQLSMTSDDGKTERLKREIEETQKTRQNLKDFWTESIPIENPLAYFEIVEKNHKQRLFDMQMNEVANAAQAGNTEEAKKLLKEADKHSHIGGDIQEITNYGLEELIRDCAKELEPIKTGYFLLHSKRQKSFELRLPSGALTILAGGQGHGKTAMLANLAINVTKFMPPKKTILFATYEEEKKDIIKRLFNIHCGIDIYEQMNGNKNKNSEQIDDEEKRNYRMIENAFYKKQGIEDLKKFFKHDDIIMERLQVFSDLLKNRLRITAKEYTADELLKVIRALHEKEELGAVFVDYLQLVDDPMPLGADGKQPFDRRSRQEELKTICKKLRELVKETGLPCIMAVQFNRNGVKKSTHEMDATDIGEAGDIERTANLVIGVRIEGDRMQLKVLKGRKMRAGHHAEYDFNDNNGEVGKYVGGLTTQVSEHIRHRDDGETHVKAHRRAYPTNKKKKGKKGKEEVDKNEMPLILGEKESGRGLTQ